MKWKSNFFSSSYKIFKDEQQIGNLKERVFRNTANGELNDAVLEFRKKGFFKPKTEIFDQETKEKVGQIQYDGWGAKANFELNGEQYSFKYTNIWNTQWIVYDENGESMIHYKSRTFSGHIETDETDDFLLLTGLYVHNYYVQISLFIVVVVVIVVSSSG